MTGAACCRAQVLAQLLPHMPGIRALLLASNSLGHQDVQLLVAALQGLAGGGSGHGISALDLTRNGLAGPAVAELLLPLLQVPPQVRLQRW